MTLAIESLLVVLGAYVGLTFAITGVLWLAFGTAPRDKREEAP